MNIKITHKPKSSPKVSVQQCIWRIPMRHGLIILIVLSASNLSGQVGLNRNCRLTKKEFVEFRKSRDQFLPTDIKSDTVVIVKYTPSRLAQLQTTARNIEFASNGEDTTGYTDEKLFGAKQAERGRRAIKKMSNDFPVNQAQALKKKGVMSIIVDEATLTTTRRYLDKYWLTTVYLCDQDGFKGPWVTTITNRIYDPGTGQYYDTFLPTNYALTDLLE